MWLKYVGISGPDGEKQNEVREYKDEMGQYLLQSWPHHFVEAKETEIPPQGSKKRTKPATIRHKKAAIEEAEE